MKVLFCFLLFIVFATAENYTFADLFEIPGADFVGFGYDSRYTETIQAVRLPLYEWNFDEARTYRYPADKRFRFKVPDELFVRTVARTDAYNYAFQNTNQLQEKLAFDAGISFLKNKTGPTTNDMDLPDRQALLEGLKSNLTGSTNATAPDSVSLADAGYGDSNDAFLPTTSISTGSRVFSLGAEFNYLKNNVDQTETWITQNEQITQYYQLFLNKRKLRQEFLDDLDRLKGRRWYSVDRELYLNFFEKYGTHVVISSMMGGAISMTSVVEQTAETDTTSVSVTVTVQNNQSSNTAENVTEHEQIIENSSNCTGDERGWSYNTLKKICQVPYELTCYSPMEFQEGFETDTPASDEWTFYNGPNKLKISNYDRFCQSARICSPYDNQILKRKDGTFSEYENDHFKLKKNGDKWHLNIFYWILWWFTFSVSETAYENPDCKRGGDFWNNAFTLYDCVAVNISFFKGPLINVTDDSSWNNDNNPYMQIDSRQQQFQLPQNEFGRRGRVIRLKNNANPKLFQFWVRSDFPPSGRHNVLELVEETPISNKTFAILAFDANLKFGLLDGSKSIVDGVSFTYGDWIKVGLNINWTDATVTLWVYEDGSEDLPRKKMTVPFLAKVTSLNKLNFYNEHQISSGSWDELSFCNKDGASKYVPVTRASAVATSTARFKQTLNGQIDFNYASSYSAFTFSQTSNYRLKGGDSSQVDLLDLRKKVSTFEIWKGTIMENPAPVSFVLKSIDEIVPDDDQRPFIKEAIDGWTTEVVIDSIYVDNSPDVSRMES